MTRYYINPQGPGGDGLSRATAFTAITSLPTLVAGDIVDFEPGSELTLAAAYTINASGASGNPIKFRTNPDVAGAKAVIRPSSETAHTILFTARSHITCENLRIVGQPTWTSQNGSGWFINGGGNSLTFVGCEAQYVGQGWHLDGGFNRTGISLINCKATYCLSDGVRWWSGAGASTWDSVLILGGEYSNNGRARGANASGIIFYIYSLSHTTQLLQNVLIEGVVASDNYGCGINVSDTQYSLLQPVGSTTPPTRNLKGIAIRKNRCERNGDSGIVLDCAGASSTAGSVIERNEVHYNGWNTTRGGIWTAANSGLLIQLNNVSHTYSNGTVTGDGQGIFDDQWNDGTICRWNTVSYGEFNSALPNPDYTAYGIGIYRTSNSKHYGNLIIGCRWGYIIGNVAGATAPVMSGIEVLNNTIVGSLKHAIAIWTAVPAGALSIRNNLIVDCDMPAKADSGTAGTQTIQNNWVYLARTANDGANIPDGGFIFMEGSAPIDSAYRPTELSALRGAGVFVRPLAGRDTKRFRNPPCIGAYEFVKPRRSLSNDADPWGAL